MTKSFSMLAISFQTINNRLPLELNFLCRTQTQTLEPMAEAELGDLAANIRTSLHFPPGVFPSPLKRPLLNNSARPLNNAEKTVYCVSGLFNYVGRNFILHQHNPVSPRSRRRRRNEPCAGTICHPSRAVQCQRRSDISISARGLFTQSLS